MPIVTISRQYASGGSEVAERVARALGWHLYDNAVVDEVAVRLGISPAEVSARATRSATSEPPEPYCREMVTIGISFSLDPGCAAAPVR